MAKAKAKAVTAPKKAETHEKVEAKQDKTAKEDTGAKKPINEGQFPGEHIIQHKPDPEDDIAGKGTFDAIGKGSVLEEAPAVRGASTEVQDRIVQQGDEVVVHLKNPIDGRMEMPGRVLKVNANGTLAVRLDLGGSFRDVTSVQNAPNDADPYFSWPAKAA